MPRVQRSPRSTKPSPAAIVRATRSRSKAIRIRGNTSDVGTRKASGRPETGRRKVAIGSQVREALSGLEARRIALAAQGLGARPEQAGLRQVRGVFDRVALIQIDSVNVVCRSQELPLWARLGSHGRDAIPELSKRKVIFEYWAHEASLMPVAFQPLLRWRMAEAATRSWRVVRTILERDPGYVAAVRDEVIARGAVTSRELESRGPGPRPKRTNSWWSWDDRKRALAYLFWAGEITATRSATTFERVYAPLERVLPAAVLAAPTPAPDDARKELLVHAARALGVATLRDLADYFRITVPVARPLVAELAEAGRLLPVAVEGWREPAYLHPDAPPPRAVTAQALLSPFDSLIWYRQRTERMFGFTYRIEIYTPAEDRKHGYYVMPFLLGDALVARVDVKADRAAGVLLVHAAYAEPGGPPGTAAALASELIAFARWLGLPRVALGRRGDLARALARAVRSAR